MTDLMHGIITIVVIIIIGIIAILIIKWLLAAAMIAPIAYATTADAEQQEQDVAAQDEQKVVDKATITENDTKITVTCTSNIPDLVSCD